VRYLYTFIYYTILMTGQPRCFIEKVMHYCAEKKHYDNITQFNTIPILSHQITGINRQGTRLTRYLHVAMYYIIF